MNNNNFFEKDGQYSLISHTEEGFFTPLNLFCEQKLKIPFKHLSLSLLIFSAAMYINSNIVNDIPKFELTINHIQEIQKKLNEDLIVKNPQIVKKEIETEKEVIESNIQEGVFVKNFLQFELSLNDLKKPLESNQKYYSSKYNKKIPTKEEIEKIASTYGIDGDLIYYVMFKESVFKHNAVSSKGALGAFQFMEETAKDFNLIDEDTGRDYRTNGYASADAACRYLLWIHKHINGNDELFENEQNLKYTLAAYNAGISNVKVGGVKKIPDFRETKDYIRAIGLLYHGKGHVIRGGDTIESIANEYNLDKLILIRNNIHQLINGNQKLIAGSVLNIENVNHDVHIKVSKNISLYKISKVLGISLDKISEINNLSNPNKVIKGQSLKIPAYEDFEISAKLKPKI